MKVSSNRFETHRMFLVIISTLRKFFKHVLEGRNFKIKYNQHRDCFQKNIKALNGGEI